MFDGVSADGLFRHQGSHNPATIANRKTPRICTDRFDETDR
jgi:hypothetical protein